MLQNEYTTVKPRRSILDTGIGMDRIGLEIVFYAILLALSMGLHLWQLDVKAMHHDESIHAWMSYKFFTGQGPFTCADSNTQDAIPAPQSATYCYDPVYHGPSLYFFTALSYFLFGVGDAQARLPQALAGIALVPMAWTLRPFIGRKGALLAAVLMTLSPSILYYTRFARHDGLVLLWSLFMVVGLFKWINHGGAKNLALAAAGLSLTWATHELVFILIFIGGSFLGLRLLWEWRPKVFYVAAVSAFLVSIGLIAAAVTVSEASSPTVYAWLQRLLGPSLMLAAGTLLTIPMALWWEPAPIVRERAILAWQENRREIWIAVAAFLIPFTLLFTTFFAYPRGFLDGWYQGINYWLLSQHEAARGGQPWFYYLLLLPIYDLLALLFGLIGLGWLTIGGVRSFFAQKLPQPVDEAAAEDDSSSNGHASRATQAATDTTLRAAPPLLVFFLGYWFIQAFIGFSWAGEKMPWLVTHISLPATLLAAWVLGRLIDRVPWRELRYDFGWTVPLLTLLLVVSLAVAAYAFSGADVTVSGIQSRLRGLIPLMFAGLCIFGLLTIGTWFGNRVVARLAGITIATVLLLYGIRATTLVVYRNPDTPIDPLIYTQTAPDVPLLVRQIKQLSINYSRTKRTAQDPTGEFGLKVVLDGGGSKSGGEGSVAWPMQWYMRDFSTNGTLNWIDTDTNPQIAPDVGVVVLAKPNVTPEIESQLEDEFVKTSEGVFNWWFPEFSDTNPNNPGETVRGYKSLGQQGAWQVLSWPLRPSNWPTLTKYMLYRDLPLQLKGREMVTYVRRDLVPGGGSAAAVPAETLVPEISFAQGQLNNARGIATDRDGNVYIADANNHRILVYSPDGTQLRQFGTIGNGDGQLNEPSGVAVDDDGNVYVADTWNARVAKFGPDGTFIKAWGGSDIPFGEKFIDPVTNQEIQRFATDNRGEPQLNEQNPLNFFGPRNVFVNGDRVYIADTGNSRIVVTDRDGNFVQQFGNRGNAPGQLHEPIGLGVDEQGRVYVGDTWNGRVQIFQPAADNTIDPNPVKVVDVSGWASNTYFDPYIAVAPDGRFWAAQGARNTIAEFDSNQTYVRRIKAEPQLSGPKGLALVPDGGLLVVNNGLNEVIKIRPR